METEGGAGGKFRKRPFRRSQATPYDRPPSALRPGLRLHAEDGGRIGWLARFVDPASRVIAGGATRFFSSVFRKRLGAPPPPPPPQTDMPTLTPTPTPTPAPLETDPESKEEVHDVSSVKILTPKVRDQGDKDEQTFKGNSENNGISELEQLLNQRTFTRDEFERLTEFLRSRTAGLSTDRRDQKAEASTSKQVIGGKEEKTGVVEKENEIRTLKLFSSTPKFHSSLKLSSGAVQESEGRITSPTEVAKAYMGSRSSKPAVPLTVHSMSHRESAVLARPKMQLKPSDTSVGPRSTIQSSGLPENGLRTPKTQGRSALYKMSRSPYFKAQTLASEKGLELSDGGRNVFPRSPLVRSDLSLSAGQQALKRRSSVLDSDLGSIGPIRRIRQKSSLDSSSKELIVPSSGRYLTTSVNGYQNSVASTQRPSASDSSKYKILEDADKRDNRFSYVPRQSTQVAGRILELVDQLVQSPKKKVSELKAGTMGESPPKLTFDMLNKQALESVKDIDSAKVLSVQENGKVDGGTESIPFKGLKPPAYPVQDKPETNGPIRLPASGMAEANGMDIMTTTEKKYGMSMGSPAALVPGAVSLRKKPAFKMQAPESSLELDTNSQGGEDASVNLASEKENLKAPTEQTKPVASEELIQKTSYVSSCSSKPGSVLMPSKEDTQTLQVKVTRRDNGFSFPVAPSESSSQAPSTPSMPSNSLAQSVPAKEEPVAPVFSFGSRSVSTLSSTTTSIGGTSGLKFSFAPSTKSEVSVSAAAPTTIIQELPSSTNVGETDKVEETVKPVGGLFSSLPASTAPVLAFGSSSSTSFSNGSLEAKSSASAVSASPTSEPSDNLPVSVASSVSVTQSFFASPTTSASTKLPTFNTTPTPAIVTVATAAGIDSDTVRTDTKDLEKPPKSPTFGLNNLSSGASASFQSLGSSNIFSFGANAPSASPASTSGQFFGLQPSQAATSTAVSPQSEESMFSSSAAAPATMAASSVFTFGSSGFGSSSSTSTFSFAPCSGAAQSSSMLFTSNASASGPSNGLSFAPSATGSSMFGSSSGSTFALTAPAMNLFSSSSSSSFPSAASSPSLFSSTTSQASSFIFGFGSSTSSQSTPSILGSGATTTSQSTPSILGSGAATTVFPFGQTSAAPTSSIAFGASSSAPFSFMSASTSTTAPVFGTQTPVFGSASGNDQMNVEDSSMTEDITQNTMTVAPVFAQAANQPMASGITFGASSLQPTTFQFSSQPTPAFPQAQSPFQAPGNLEFAAGGSFSLGSGGGDKSGRRIVKVKRDKLRKK